MNQTLVKILSCFIPNKNLRKRFRGQYGWTALDNYGIKHVYNKHDAQQIIADKINGNEPCLVCRFGGTEMRVVDYFLKHMHKNSVNFPNKIKNMINTLSGFFPANNYMLTRFSSEFIHLTKDIDILAVWNTRSEKYICEHYLSDDAKLIDLPALDTISCNNPWSQALAGKKVLVIHPFAESIEKQYANRKNVFSRKPEILPDFELITMKPVQSLSADKTDLPYENWFEALQSMKNQISQIDFDIAIVGAGAYGIFLAHYCKQLGKKAVHMGGVTQLLFGILGKRWEVDQPHVVKDVVNEYWIHPGESEKPKHADKVEGACYW